MCFDEKKRYKRLVEFLLTGILQPRGPALETRYYRQRAQSSTDVRCCELCFVRRDKMAKHHKERQSSTSNVRDFVTVVLTEDIEQARQSRELLRSNEIPAIIKKNTTGNLGGPSIALLVPEDFLDEAHVLIESQNAYDDFYDLAFEDNENIEPFDGNLTEDDF